MKHKCKKSGFTPLEMEVKISNRRGKRFLTGFTLVELLTVLAIVALLAGMLVPALNLVRNIARETRQKAQFATIEQALLAFRGDYGNYPPSVGLPPNYCGAQQLAEALLGWDLLGFHPDSGWTADDVDVIYDLTGLTEEQIKYNLDQRVGPYLELATANAFRLGNKPLENKPGLFDDTGPLLDPYPFVLCDSFGVKKIPIGEETVRAGTPILYYRANTSSKTMTGGVQNRIYNYRDNDLLVKLGKITDTSKQHPLDDTLFYSEKFIIDPKVTARLWPYRPDSYILISAGADGLYGTSDDITNFGN